MDETGGQGGRAMHRQRVTFRRPGGANQRERRYTQREGNGYEYTQADTQAGIH
jgi:hypothetical protein